MITPPHKEQKISKRLLMLKSITTRYIDWVIRLGRIKFSILGIVLLAFFALLMQVILSFIFVGELLWEDILRSICFGLFSAPFVVYFFTLLVERLERSRLRLASLVDNLRHEIADRIKAEKRLSEALATLNQNHREKSALMATISHELRTPLNGIIGLSRILLDDNLTENQRNYLQTINMSAVALGHIFSDIIDLEKIDANCIELHQKETEFPRFIQDIANFANLMTQQRKLNFQLNCADDLPQWLTLDSARLSQVLWNLISNATKFTPEGKITLNVENRGNNTYAFVIEDTGIGIPNEELNRIFDMYYQVQSSGYKPAGSGIGLAVSKIIARLMNGDLTVTSVLGKGSIFTLTFKAEETVKPFCGIEHLPTELNVLLVEDIEVNIIVAKAMLEQLGYHIDVAMTGTEAKEKALQNNYDLILLDIQLPDITGFEVGQFLRSEYEADRIDYLPPMIALTANVLPSKADYQKQGMDDVLPKPLELENLLKTLLNVFGEEVINNQTLKNFCSDNRKNFAFFNNEQEERFDEHLIQELITLLGIDFLKENLSLFQNTMPTYVNALQKSLIAYELNPSPQNIENLTNEAHKIKGATASLGLKALQLIMEQAQHAEREYWAENIKNWVNEVANTWQQDVDTLLDRLENKQNDKI